MSSWTKHHKAAAPPPGFASLPPQLADAIVSYAVEDTALRFGSLPYDKPAIPVAFSVLAAVSKGWGATIDEITSFRALQSVAIKESTTLKRSDMLNMRNHLNLRRVWTRRLRIGETSRLNVAAGGGFWSAALAHVPLLTDLELCEPLSSAAESLEQLVLPDHHLGEQQREARPRAAAYGLSNYVADGPTACDYINCVLETCSNIQVLDGYKGSLSFFALVSCDEQWMLDLTAWELFCKTCTQLREFNWICVPYTTAFFKVFGRYPKPQLKKLTLMMSKSWEWDAYNREIDPSTRAKLHANGYGSTAKDTLAVLKACPALEALTVDWYKAGNEMDIEIYGDSFVMAMVYGCPKLSRVTISQINPVGFPVVTIQSFTDRSLQALCHLQDLATVELSGCNITGAGLMSLLTCRSPNRCRFQLRLGDYSNTPASLVFDHALIDFLERLAMYDGPIRRRVSLHLINDKTHWLDERPCLDTIIKAKRLCQRVQTKHPVLRLHGLVTVVGTQSEQFKRLREFIVVTDASPPPPWNQGGHRNSIPDANIDSVLVLRRLLGAEDSRDGDSN